MPAYVRGYVVCETCGKTASARAQVSERDGTELWWRELPEGWQLFARGKQTVLAYCSSKCNTKSAVIGWPDFTGKRSADTDAFDARTVDKVFELLETASSGKAGADTILAAIEAVLMAWRKSGQPG